MFEKQLKNRSFATCLATTTMDRTGREVLLVVSKLALRFDSSGRLRLDARPIRPEDESDAGGGVRFPHDVADEKPGFDFGLVGTARAFGQGATSRVASVSVAGHKKSIRLFGPRVYARALTKPEPGPPGPLGDVPLQYHLCFGGSETDAQGVKTSSHPQNPIGRGFARDPSVLVGKPCPEIELAEKPGAESMSAAHHAAFGPLSDQWSPRKECSGTHDTKWARTRAPVRPSDYDPAFERWAPLDQRLDRAPASDIEVELAGLRPTEAQKPLRLVLPRFRVEHTLSIRGAETRTTPEPDSLLIDLDGSVVELTSRSVHTLPRKWEHLDSISIMGTQLAREVLAPSDVALAKEGRFGESQ